MHALGNAVDLGPRNCCHSIKCKDFAQGLSSKRRFVLSYIYIPFAVPESLVESKSFEERPVQRLGGGGDVTYLSQLWEGTARK